VDSGDSNRNAQSARPKEKAIAFTQVDQIVEILSEAVRLKLTVLLRTSATSKAVRATMENLNVEEGGLRLSGISAAGDQLLRGFDVVKVEFILLSKKLVFVASVKGRVASKLLLSLPERIVAIERRNNARFRVPSNLAAFVEFPDRPIEVGRFDVPFVPKFMQAENKAFAKLRVDDVSLGGVACFSRYSGIAEAFRAEESHVPAVFFFPGLAPISVPVSIRWTKKTTAVIESGRFETAKRLLGNRFRTHMTSTEKDAKETFYRLGLQFHEVPKELDTALRQFIRRAQASESI
jgi:c-di-GMP-binding flagellar brake protein YcgR